MKTIKQFILALIVGLSAFQIINAQSINDFETEQNKQYYHPANAFKHLGNTMNPLLYAPQTTSDLKKNGEIWRPLIGYSHGFVEGQFIHHSNLHYTYDAQGNQIASYMQPLVPEKDSVSCTFNPRYGDGGLGLQFEDYVFFTRYNNEWIPNQNYYNELHYYDSLYVNMISRTWDRQNNYWRKVYKIHYQYPDTTTMTPSEYLVYTADNHDEWVLQSGYKFELHYNDNGYVYEAIRKLYNPDSKEFENAYLEAFILGDDGRYTESFHYVWNDPIWEPNRHRINFEWEEWHGFEHKDNKLSSFTSVTLDEGIPYFFEKYSYGVELGNFFVDTDSSYIKLLDIDWFCHISNVSFFDQYGNYCGLESVEWHQPDENGIQTPVGYGWNQIEYIYDTTYNYPIEYRWYSHHDYPNPPILEDLIVYDNFVDITKVGIDEHLLVVNMPLSIFPNPTNGNVFISASADLKQIEIFDLMGRLVKTQSGFSGKETILELGNLPKGVYITKAQLQNSNVQTGKVVVQ